MRVSDGSMEYDAKKGSIEILWCGFELEIIFKEDERTRERGS